MFFPYLFLFHVLISFVQGSDTTPISAAVLTKIQEPQQADHPEL